MQTLISESFLPNIVCNMTNKNSDKKQNKLPQNAVILKQAGDLILPTLATPSKNHPFFNKLEFFFEQLANKDRVQRMIAYKMIAALSFTSHARKITSEEERRKLYEFKNNIYLDIANNEAARRLVSFKYLKDQKRALVVKYCDSCTKENTAKDLPKFKWQYCQRCETKPNFFDVLAMTHRSENFSLSIFLSFEQTKKLKNLNVMKKGQREEADERMSIQKLNVTVRSLAALDLNSCVEIYNKFLGRF